MMNLPYVTYGSNGVNFSLQFKRGPRDFICYSNARVHDNISTSGLRERVVEAIHLMITFGMGALRIGDDYEEWSAFYAFALAGNSFAFSPTGGGAYFNCWVEDETFQTGRKGPGTYAAKCVWRIVPDDLQPADDGMVMDMFYQISSPVAVTASSLPGGAHGSAYSATLSATGGSVYTWSIATPQGLPPGVTLSAGGVLSGTPAAAGTYAFIAKVVSGVWIAFGNFSVVIS